MDLFTYLMAKKGHNTHRDLFSYLLGKGEGGTYTTYYGTSLNISNTLQAKIKNIALEGNTSQDGTPTPDAPIPIKVVTGEQNIKIHNKNLLPGKIFEHCTITNTGEKTIDNSRACSDFIKVISNDNYYLSYGVINGFTGIAFYDEIYNYISRIIWSNEISHIITIPNNIEYVKIFLQKNTPLIATENQFADDKVQFVKSNVATDYIEHEEQTYPLSLGNIELAGINDYKNYIFKNEVGSPYYNANLDLNGWYYSNLFTKINSYNEETITTPYISTTGGLDIGATIYYYNNSNVPIKVTDTTLIQQLENINNNARSYKDTTIIECTSESDDNETIGFSGDIKVSSVGLGNSLNTSLLSSNLQEKTNIDDIQEEPNLDDANEIEEQNDEPIENEEIEEKVS